MFETLLSWWCRWTHDDLMWPIKGQVRCRRCLRTRPLAIGDTYVSDRAPVAKSALAREWFVWPA